MMRRIVLVGLCASALGLLACSSNGGDDVVDSGPDIDAPSVPDAGPEACNPVEGTGCAVGEKCTWIVDAVDPNYLAYTGCIADGTVANGLACVSPELGADNCVALNYCLNEVCTEICFGDSCGAAEDWVCSPYNQLFDDLTDVGLCNPTCNPVEQNCAVATEACYLQAISGVASCAGRPTGAEGVTQDDACYGPTAGGCFLNGCDTGYGVGQPDDTCSFFCNTIDNWDGNVQGLSGDPAGVTCAAQFGGTRPDGPGPTYECKYMQSFYSNTDLVPAYVGHCVLPSKAPTADWGAYGSCGDFDWVQLQSDVLDETANQTGYCDTICPECCMVECISLNTWDLAFPEKSGRAHYSCFSELEEVRATCGLK